MDKLPDADLHSMKPSLASISASPNPSVDIARVESAQSYEMLAPDGATADKLQKKPPLPRSVQCGIALRRSWRWMTTPMGFLITVYMLNVIAWGGMLFLLMCNAAPAMCHPDCNDIESPRRKWIEIDSQILNALFCVTGFGLAPFRLRDLYWWCVWRFARTSARRNVGIGRLAGIHASWYRLPAPADVDVEGLDTLAPIPASKAPSPPLTGVRAPPTAAWKMTFVVYNMISNTILQGCLAGCMWAWNRYDRPSWTTGLFIGLACVVAMAAGGMITMEGNRVKKIEGAPMSKEEEAARKKLRLATGSV